jgi:glycosyltransferase involved in cell wall biosynthesis
MVKSILLSICVPSYNQREALTTTLDSLTQIGPEFKNRVEILVSDNGSTDDSVNISKQILAVSEIEVQFLEREDSSFGTFCDNLSQLLRYASGSYIWFVGCGEYVLVNRLQEILQMLESEKPSNLILNSATYGSHLELSSQLERLRSINYGVEAKSFPRPTDEYSLPFDHSVSCNITKRDVFFTGGLLELGSEIRWPHIDSMFSAMGLGNFSALTLQFDAILVHQPSDGWYSSGQNWSIYIELCNVYFHHATQLTKIGSPWASTIQTLARELVSKDSLWLIFSFRRLGAPPKLRVFFELFRIYSAVSKYNSMLLVLVLITPSFLIRVLRKFHSA